MASWISLILTMTSGFISVPACPSMLALPALRSYAARMTSTVDSSCWGVLRRALHPIKVHERHKWYCADESRIRSFCQCGNEDPIQVAHKTSPHGRNLQGARPS